MARRAKPAKTTDRNGYAKAVYRAPLPKPETIAREKWDDATRDWASKAQSIIQKAVRKIPGAGAYILALCETKLYHAASAYDRAKADRSAKSPGMLARLNAVTNLSLDDFLALDEDVGVVELFGYDDPNPHILDALAKVIKVDLPALPKLDDFLKDAKAANAKLPAKKTKAAAADPGNDDDEDLDTEEVP